MIKAAQGRIHTLACLKRIPVCRGANTPFDPFELHSSGSTGCKILRPEPIPYHVSLRWDGPDAGTRLWGAKREAKANPLWHPVREIRLRTLVRHKRTLDRSWRNSLFLKEASGAWDTRPVQREARTS